MSSDMSLIRYGSLLSFLIEVLGTISGGELATKTLRGVYHEFISRLGFAL
jgi:hypothetical protein